MSDIDIGQITEALNDKMDRDGVNASCPVVISRTANSNGGVTEIWSDGYCIQTGVVSFSGYTAIVPLDQEYKDNSYNVQITPNEQTTYAYGAGVNSKTISSFTIRGALYSGGSIGIPSDWRTEGYIR